MARRHLPGGILVVLLLLAPALGWGAGGNGGGILRLDCPFLREGSVRVDGFFEDWMEAVGVRSEGIVRGRGSWTGGKDLTLEVRCAREATSLYLVLGVLDDHLLPSADRIRVRFPSRHGPDAELTIRPGDLEETAPRATLTPAPPGAPGAVRIDGAPRPTGYILELAVPLPGLPPGEFSGRRAVVEIEDADGRSAAVGSRGVSVLRQEVLLAHPEADGLWAAYLTSAGLDPSIRASHEATGDVGGDPTLERVALVGAHLVVLRTGNGEGEFFDYLLPYGERALPDSLELLDLDGCGRDEIVTAFHVEHEVGGRRVRQGFCGVFALEEGGLVPLVLQEVSYEEAGGGRTANGVRFVGKGTPKVALEVTRGRAERGLEPEGFVDVDAGTAVPYETLLLPWAEPRLRRIPLRRR